VVLEFGSPGCVNGNRRGGSIGRSESPERRGRIASLPTKADQPLHRRGGTAQFQLIPVQLHVVGSPWLMGRECSLLGLLRPDQRSKRNSRPGEFRHIAGEDVRCLTAQDAPAASPAG
jgi:hypothetical protein